MHQSPRIRRLHSDLAALERLRSESSVFRFTATGDPPQQYNIILAGKSLWRDRGKARTLEQHRVEIKLGASYPRSIPEIRWLTPIFHPNISEIGMVCLGGYGTHWVPSVQLDDLCVMLWDMARYFNYDIRSPYNREAALWVAGQTTFRFPIDARPLRDLRASIGRGDSRGANGTTDAAGLRAGGSRSSSPAASNTPVARVLQFIERYGRGANDVPPRIAERRSSTEVTARAHPEATTEGCSVDRSSDSASNVSAPAMAPDNPELARDQTAGGKVEAAGGREMAAATAPESSQDRLDADQDDVMILEAVTDEAQNAPTRTSDDEVMFIS
jgi:ubiquitin-protein ligase